MFNKYFDKTNLFVIFVTKMADICNGEYFKRKTSSDALPTYVNKIQTKFGDDH